MHRTQIMLDERQYEALKARARRENKSLADLIRLAVNAVYVRTSKGRLGLDSICGIAKDHRASAAREHDRILYGAPK